eukprot:6340596-Pyramimonas_sp.AAC.2
MFGSAWGFFRNKRSTRHFLALLLAVFAVVLWVQHSSPPWGWGRGRAGVPPVKVKYRRSTRGKDKYVPTDAEVLREFFEEIGPGTSARDRRQVELGARCEEMLYFGGWPVCLDAVTERDGLVYGIGIDNDWDFEAAAGNAGFQVNIDGLPQIEPS